MAIGAKKITLPITNESTGTVSNVEYSFVQVDNTLATAGAAADAKKVGDELSDLKQDLQEFPNGNYPNMTAGNAEQLVSTVFVEDEVPYNFRTSGGSVDIGDREYDEIVGGSIVLNQLVKSLSNDNWSAESGVTATYDNGVVTISSATSGNGIQHRTPIVAQEHKYFATMSVYGASGLTVAISGIPATSGIAIDYTISSANTWQTASKIISCGLSGNMSLYALARGGTYENVKMRDIRITDLTLMLGTQIADYVYGLEQSTAGSGVAWLKHHFPKIFDSGYIPYNAGEIQSVSGLSAHRMTGLNQWDEVWEPGVYNNTGQPIYYNTEIRSKNYIEIVPGQTYRFTSPKPLYVTYYDADYNCLGETGAQNTTRTFSERVKYIRFCTGSSYGGTYHNDICINLHWDGERDGEYEEYKEYEYALDDSVVLRGILKLDSNNQLYADGDRYLADGTVQRRYGVVDLGTLSWYKNNDGQFYASSNPMGKDDVDGNNVVCSKYASGNAYTGSVDKVICIQGASTGRIWVKDAIYNDATAFKTAVSGTQLVYELATPTAETAESYQTPQIVDDWGTEEYVSTSLVPVGHYTKYAPNLRAKLEMAPESPAGNGDYIVRQTNGENEYVALGSTTTIQNILDRLTALENA